MCYVPPGPLNCVWYKTYDVYCPWETKKTCPFPFNLIDFYKVAPTGCVATAMGQIMKYWSWPPVGQGSGSNDPPYPCPAGSVCEGYDLTEIDFSTRHYNWAAMSLHVIEFWNPPDYEISALLRDIGVAVKMDYRPGGSYAFSTIAESAFVNHFRYKATLKDRTDIPKPWVEQLRDELNAGQPMYYRGTDASDPTKGHAFVCDGYSGVDPNHFHFNWGWDGQYDGYYYLDSLIPGEYNYNSNQWAILGIEPHHTSEVWVDDNYGPGTPGWGADRFASIQDGINAVPADGAVLVYAGTYNENITLQKDGIRIIGVNGANVTIIDGGQTGSVISAAFIGSETVIDGFTIRNGSGADHLGNGRNVGGGIFFRHVDLARISNCIFNNNSAEDGGAILTYWSTPHLMNCTFNNNHATGSGIHGMGGAIHIDYDSSPSIENCTFTDNSAVEEGGGMYISAASATITNCVFTGNTATYGGGIQAYHCSSPTITNCRFELNTASDRGGGIYNQNSTTTLTNCVFSGNFARDEGGGAANYLSAAKYYNCVFYGNTAEPTFASNGGGMYNQESSPILTNCIFSGNVALEGGGLYNMMLSNPIVTNCIFCADTGGEIRNYASSSYPSNPIVTYSDVQGGYAGEGNKNADPAFMGAAYGDFHLRQGSPCIDAGSNAAVAGIETDLEGHLRIWPVGGTVDMGIDEYKHAIVYVDADATGRNNGTSWADAFRKLTDGLNAAGCGDDVWVAAGTYKPTTGTDRNISFAMKNGVAIYGGFAGNEEPNDFIDRDIVKNETILSGDIGVVSDNSDNTFQVVSNLSALYLNETAILDGFTITGGNANEAWHFGRVGGGMYNECSPVVRNCVFRDNYGRWGGGIYNYACVPLLINCAFAGNTCQHDGAGFNNNSAHPTVVNCTFFSNSGGGNGCGMFNLNSAPTVTNCVFWDNTGIDNTQIYNSGASSPTVSYSCVQDDDSNDASVYPGVGNIDADPVFVQNDDFHLQASSPCLDAGDNTAVPAGVTTDLDGRLRFFDDPCTADSGNGTPPVVDMGAYEYGSCLAVRGDLDYNCSVDFFDFSIFGRAWMTQQGDSGWDWACDMSYPPDDYIDWRDVATLCDNWLAQIP